MRRAAFVAILLVGSTAVASPTEAVAIARAKGWEDAARHHDVALVMKRTRLPLTITINQRPTKIANRAQLEKTINHMMWSSGHAQWSSQASDAHTRQVGYVADLGEGFVAATYTVADAGLVTEIVYSVTDGGV